MASEAAGGSHSNDDLRPDEFWAVSDVSFELRRGECLGLIGRNGAGKTTLLKMLNGLIKPDQGRIEIRGRVGALIALGAGFNPILTGRENIYVNGSVLGLSKKEIDAKLDDIVDFAGTGDFIDAPVQAYSSGMQVRLGFAIATALEPDILLLDEVLAVGDAQFRAKCYNRIGELQKNAAVIFVSHTMDQIARISSSVLVMSRGRGICLGSPQEGIAAYEKENQSAVNADGAFISFANPFRSGSVRFVSSSVRWNEPLELEIDVQSDASVERPSIYGALYDSAGAIAASFTVDDTHSAGFSQGWNRARVRIENLPLATGTYRLGLTIHPEANMTNLLWSYKQAVLDVHSSASGFCACRLRAQMQVVTRKQQPKRQVPTRR